MRIYFNLKIDIVNIVGNINFLNQLHIDVNLWA